MSIRLDRSCQRGLTLVELIVAIVIIGVCVAGVMATYTNAVRSSADPMMVKQSYAIAEALLEEAQQAPFLFCDANDPRAEIASGPGDCTGGFGPPAPARPFDDVRKYNGRSFTTAPGNRISGVDNVEIPGLEAYAANITVAPAALGATTANPIAAAESVLITVRVTAPDGNAYSLEGYRTRYAPNAAP